MACGAHAVYCAGGVQHPALGGKGRRAVCTISDPAAHHQLFELLQWVDAVYIAVPNLQHARYARVALEAGKHVIVEKPMAVTAAETEELAALAQRKRLFLFEAMTTQYQPNYAKLRELLPRVGTVRMVQCSFSQYSSRYDAFCAGQTPPVFDRCARAAH